MVSLNVILKNLTNIRGNDGSYTENKKYHIPNSFAYKRTCMNDKCSKPIVLYKRKNVVYKFTEPILKEYEYYKKVMKKHFNKNLAMSAEDEETFQSSNKCWICNKLFTDEGKKVRGHDHITGKYRSSAHSNCNNLKLTKKVPVIFHNLRGYDSHLIIQGISKCYVKITVKPSGLENYMAFAINKSLVLLTECNL